MSDLRIRYADVDGLRQAYFEAGRGPLVLCVHGFPDTAHTFLPTLAVLAERGFHAVAPFLRGYPPSAAPHSSDYRIATLGSDLIGLATTLGAERFALVGHDWGALASYAAASQAPERVTRLAVLAIPHLRAQRASLAQARRSWYIGFFQLPVLPERRVRRDGFAFVDRLWRDWSPGWRYAAADIAPVKECFAQPGALEAALGYYRALPSSLLQHRATRRAVFGKITVPTLSVAGVDDGCMGIEMFDRQDVGFVASHRTLRIEAAGHFMHREQPATFHRELVEFLGKPRDLARPTPRGGSA